MQFNSKDAVKHTYAHAIGILVFHERNQVAKTDIKFEIQRIWQSTKKYYFSLRRLSF